MASVNLTIFLVLIFSAIGVLQVNCANILNLMGCPSPSHHIWNTVLVNDLAAKGHNITVLSTNVDLRAPKNVHYIHLETVYDFIYNDTGMDLIAMASLSHIGALNALYEFSIAACLGITRSNGLQTLLNYPKDFKFDLVLYDYTLGPCLIGFLHRFNYPPLVSFTAFNNPPYTSEIVGGHKYFSYRPYLTTRYSYPMTFLERAITLYMYTLDYYKREYEMVPFLDQLSKQMFGADCPNGRELEQRTQIALVSTHPIIDSAESLPPNVIAIGGLQIVEPKTLPQDIETFISAGKEGAVFFSLGTNVKSKDLNLEQQRAIVEAFRQMPQYNFLWKFEETNFPLPLPPNVMLRKWFCQNDILNHTNIKAFVTHGGSLSTYEASWYGVPTIGIPFIADQYTNIYKSVEAGSSEIINFAEINTENVKDKILKVLTKPSYRENMKKRSKLLRDQPEKPRERAIWWIEYVLRNPDASHLRTPTVQMGFIQANSIDLYAVIYTAFLIIIFSLLYLVQKLIPRESNTKESKLKKN